MLTLVVITGLPCTGKSTLAEALARRLNLPLFSVDPIVAVMWRHNLEPGQTGIAAPLGGRPAVRAGYDIAANLADEHLGRGTSVIVDAVSPQDWARQPWYQAAAKHQAKVAVIECICSDEDLHRRRTEDRLRNIPGMPEITWKAVLQRKADFEPWELPHLVLDSIRPSEDILNEALAYVKL
jgi:predicted kinase